MTTDRDDPIQRLLDREAIRTCLAHYCRGVDRLDKDILLSAYHVDAVEDHGAVVGPLQDFIDWVFGPFQKNLLVSHHVVHNTSFDFDGDTAHCETYWTYNEIRSVAPHSAQVGGRYVDRFECRAGRWAIAARVVVVDWIIRAPGQPAQAFASVLSKQSSGTRDRSDPSYRRPLTLEAGAQ